MRETFGPRLKAERERRGISLDSIAAKTKIKKSFLESLERGDFSKWPAGTVFRRAYVRHYASAIGLSPESVLVDFIRLFPVDDVSPAHRAKPAAAAPQEDPSPLALTFDKASTWQTRLAGRRAGAAAIDACGLFALGGILALLTGSSVWTVTGTLAFVYYPATAVLWGRTIASRYLETRPMRRQVISISGVERAIAETTAPRVAEPPAAPVQTVVSRLEAVVDPLFLTATNRSHPAHLPQETTTH
jgi:transcriptional regulator with XRE-family HTH domain